MIKNFLVISTIVMFIFSSMAFARGGKENGRNGKTYSASTGKGTITQTKSQTRTQKRDGSGKADSATKGSGDKAQDRLRDRLQKRLKDGSCNNQI